MLGLAAHSIPVGVDQGADELVAIPDDRHLLDDRIYREQTLQHLWGDILPVRRLEEVLDTLREVEDTVLHPSSVSRTEVAIGGEGLFVGLRIIVVSSGDSRPLELDLAGLGIDPHTQ